MSEAREISERLPLGKAPYPRYVAAAAHHAALTMLRRKRTVLAGVIALAPVIIPLLLAVFTEGAFGHEGGRIFVTLVEDIYVKTLVPLLALFFGTMLIGEDVESQIIPYWLTRPVPRSAVALGRLTAFMLVTTALIVPGVFLTFAACTSLGNFSFSGAHLRLMLHYDAALVAGLLVYGAFCMWLGACFKRPIVVGIAALFGWQRLALYVPGLVDFFTIEKYVAAVLPPLPQARATPVFRTALAEFQKTQFLVGATKAAVVLLVITVVFIALTVVALRRREYSQAKAVEN